MLRQVEHKGINFPRLGQAVDVVRQFEVRFRAQSAAHHQRGEVQRHAGGTLRVQSTQGEVVDHLGFRIGLLFSLGVLGLRQRRGMAQVQQP